MAKIIVDLLDPIGKAPDFIWRATYPALIEFRKPLRVYFNESAQQVFPKENYVYIGEVLKELYSDNEHLLRRGQVNLLHIYSDSNKNKLIDWNSITGIRKWPCGNPTLLFHHNIFKNGTLFKESPSEDTRIMVANELVNMLESKSKNSYVHDLKEITGSHTWKRQILDI